MNISQELYNWNIVRNNLELDIDLETSMLTEESKEFMDAMAVGDVVGAVDAVCDFIFVAEGTELKVLNAEFCNAADYNRAVALVQNAQRHVKMLIAQLEAFCPRISTHDVIECLELVIIANKKKPLKKTSGKVEKGNEWRDPKEDIKTYLINEGIIDQDGNVI